MLAEISSLFAKHQVSIQTVRQDGLGKDANLIIRTHRAKESALANVLKDLKQLSVVKKIDGVMRVEGDETS